MKKLNRDNTTDYLIRAVPVDAWQNARRRAATNGTTMRHVIIEAIRRYADGLETPSERAAAENAAAKPS